MGDIYTAAGKEKRFFCFLKHFQSSFQLADMNTGVWLVSADINILRIFRTSQFCHDIFRKIDKDRSGSACACNIKSFFYNSAKIFTIPYRDTIFGDTSCDSHNINFLECIVSDKMTGNLTCEANQRYTVIVGGGKSCNKVGGTRAAGYKAYADFAGGSGIGIGFVNEGLFVTWEDDFYIVLFVEFIADVDGTGTRITEKVLYAFFF